MEKQQAIRKKMQWFQRLPKEKRRALRERWERMTPQQRQRFKQRVIERQHQRKQFLQRLSPAERSKLRSMPRSERRAYFRKWRARQR